MAPPSAKFLVKTLVFVLFASLLLQTLKHSSSNYFSSRIIHQSQVDTSQMFSHYQFRFRNDQSNNSLKTVTSLINKTEYNNYNVYSTDLCDVKNAPWSKKGGSFTLKEDNRKYFVEVGKTYCFREGMDFGNSLLPSDPNGEINCPCRSGWFGQHCSIPASVKYSNYPTDPGHTPVPLINKATRRIINAFPFNNEFEILEARFHEIGDLVDVFLIMESNYTAHGDPKPLRLLQRLRQGHFSHISCKIVHIFLDYFPKGADKNGWIAENLNRDFIGTQGLEKQLIDYRDDDIIVLNDADEVPSRETFLFLKTHTGYPEPIGITYSALCYGFFWINRRKPFMFVMAAMTVRMAREVFKNHLINIRKSASYVNGGWCKSDPKTCEKLSQYSKDYNTVKVWKFGSLDTDYFETHKTHSGWHCSYCVTPENIALKLTSAQNGDFPRWGDYPEKLKPEYIQELVKMGRAFNDEKTLKENDPLNPHYAPRFFYENFDKYKYLMINPYRKQEAPEGA